MSDVTAIVLSSRPVTLTLPGVEVLGSVQTFKTPTELHDVRLDVLKKVQTPFCFYLDDDDSLPRDYLDVLAECMAHETALAYTNETVKRIGHPARDSISGPYNRADHLKSPMLVHHLAVMRTDDAIKAADRLPRGAYWTEQMLYMALAEGGAAHVNRIGYIWNRSNGLSTNPKIIIAQVATATWCNREASWH